MVAELQAIILAGGEGSKMFPLTEGLPKCLLPIGNMPMIWYVVNYLEKSGFRNLIVVVRSNVSAKVSQVLHSLFSNVSFDVVSLPDDQDVGTVDALRLVKGKIKTDVLIVSSDMMTDIPLHQLVDTHRTYDANLTAMFAKRVELQQPEATKIDKKKKPVDPNYGTRDLVAVDSKESRLLFLSNEADLEEENMCIKKSTLKKYPHIRIETELTDCHLYIMKKWLVHYLANNSTFENIKSDFVPYVIRKQFSKPKKASPAYNNSNKDLSFLAEDAEVLSSSSTSEKDIFSYCEVSEVSKYLQEWSGYDGRCLNDKIKCHAFISEGFCLRVNTLPTYAHINRQITKFKDTIASSADLQVVHPSTTLSGKSQIGNDCLIGKSVTVGNNVTIKKSVVGEHCKIYSNVKISNCILMNGCTVEDGCTLQGSVICDGAVVGPNCSLLNCQVASGHCVGENSEVKNEAIVQEEMEFEE